VSRSRRELIRVDVVAQVQQDFLQGVSASCRFWSDIKCEGSPENQAHTRPGSLSSVDGAAAEAPSLTLLMVLPVL
jgi:hypothetical protein